MEHRSGELFLKFVSLSVCAGKMTHSQNSGKHITLTFHFGWFMLLSNGAKCCRAFNVERQFNIIVKVVWLISDSTRGSGGVRFIQQVEGFNARYIFIPRRFARDSAAVTIVTRVCLCDVSFCLHTPMRTRPTFAARVSWGVRL